MYTWNRIKNGVLSVEWNIIAKKLTINPIRATKFLNRKLLFT